MAGAGHHIRCLGSDGSVDRVLTATVESGAQMAGSRRAQVSAVDQVAVVGSSTGRAWILQVVPDGAGEVSRAAAVRHTDSRYGFS